MGAISSRDRAVELLRNYFASVGYNIALLTEINQTQLLLRLVSALEADHISMEVLQICMYPSSKTLEDEPQLRSTLGQLKSVVARGGLRSSTFDQFETGEQLEPIREDVGRDVFG